jgi:hypothetical protein
MDLVQYRLATAIRDVVTGALKEMLTIGCGSRISISHDIWLILIFLFLE